MYELPERMGRDGTVSVSRPDEESISIAAVDKGHMQPMTVGRYNAARILVLLCVMLEVKSPKELGKMPL